MPEQHDICCDMCGTARYEIDSLIGIGIDLSRGDIICCDMEDVFDPEKGYKQ